MILAATKLNKITYLKGFVDVYIIDFEYSLKIPSTWTQIIPDCTREISNSTPSLSVLERSDNRS